MTAKEELERIIRNNCCLYSDGIGRWIITDVSKLIDAILDGFEIKVKDEQNNP